MSNEKSIPVLQHISEIGDGFDVWFLDIWGVLHNGVRPYDGAVSACEMFRGAGGRVILVSNSPRPRNGVLTQLDHVGVPRSAYDAVLTSGDVSRALIGDYRDRGIFHLGPHRDLPVYEGLGVSLVDAAEAAAIVCTGLVDDENETPEDYRDRLAVFQARGLEMICVNPDIRVERGGRMIYCAGALAEAYAACGGKVHYAGKPHEPIYNAAFEIAEDFLGRALDKRRVLAIGDGVKTDIEGALMAGVAAVYIASLVHVRRGEALGEAAERLFPDATRRPIAVMAALA